MRYHNVRSKLQSQPRPTTSITLSSDNFVSVRFRNSIFAPEQDSKSFYMPLLALDDFFGAGHSAQDSLINPGSCIQGSAQGFE